jgi:hypothetical protein
MTIASVNVKHSHLKVRCSRDNHVMKFESVGSGQIPGTNRHTIVVTWDAAFDITLPTDISCSWECLATRTVSTSPA